MFIKLTNDKGNKFIIPDDGIKLVEECEDCTKILYAVQKDVLEIKVQESPDVIYGMLREDKEDKN